MGSSRGLSPLISEQGTGGQRPKSSHAGKGEGDRRLGDPCDLGRKTLDVVLLLLEPRGGDEHREVGVLDAKLLDLGVEPSLDLFPDGVRLGAENVAARDVVIAV